MPRPKKEEALDLETPIEEVVETKAEKSKSTENKSAGAKRGVVRPVLTTELFAVQVKRTDI